VAGRRALFLDWGGTLALTQDQRTVMDADGHPVLMPNVEATLRRVRPAYDACFIVSNQARIGRGEISDAEVRRRFAWLDRQVGRMITDVRICPHDDDDHCRCRKPMPGMFIDLARIYGIDLVASTHVGDAEKDRAAAAAAGIGHFVWARDFFRW
jgi:D-glycero-D-manno-heptose 1,7-bisphosphate phosphatase